MNINYINKSTPDATLILNCISDPAKWFTEKVAEINIVRSLFKG